MGKTLAELEQEMHKEFFVETIEVRNETDKPIFATAVKSMLGNLFVHIYSDEGYEVKPHNYRLVPIEKEQPQIDNPKKSEEPT